MRVDPNKEGRTTYQPTETNRLMTSVNKMTPVTTVTETSSELLKIRHQTYDGPHNFSNAERVVKLAQLLYNDMRKDTEPGKFGYDWRIIHLTCLLPDVGDRDYMPDFQPDDCHLSTPKKGERSRKEACSRMRESSQDSAQLEDDHKATMMKNILHLFASCKQSSGNHYGSLLQSRSLTT